VPEWLGGQQSAQAAPVEHVRSLVAAFASREDAEAWYVLAEAFERLCGEYSPRETARALRDLGFLRCDPGRLTAKGPKRLFPSRPNLFCILKGIAAPSTQGGGHA